MRKYGLWVVWFQKDIPTEIPIIWASHFLERSTYKKNAIYPIIKQTKSIESPGNHPLREEHCLLKALLLVKNAESSLGRQMYVTNSSVFNMSLSKAIRCYMAHSAGGRSKNGEGNQ